MNDYALYASIFNALGDEKRLAIIEELRSGEKCTCVLMDRLKMAQSALSYHIKILCDANILQGRPHSKWTYYSINESGCQHAYEVLKKITEVPKITAISNSKE